MYIRQGDLLFVPVEEVPDQDKPFWWTPQRTNTRILAAGEATGHHHQIAEADAPYTEVYAVPNREPSFLRVNAEGGISIVHEEHGTVHIPAGTYRIHRAREYDYVADVVRQVRD